MSKGSKGRNLFGMKKFRIDAQNEPNTTCIVCYSQECSADLKLFVLCDRIHAIRKNGSFKQTNTVQTKQMQNRQA